MAAKRPTTGRRPRNGHPALYAFGEAYHDAMYAVMLGEIERVLEKDPERRDRIRKLTRELLISMADALK